MLNVIRLLPLGDRTIVPMGTHQLMINDMIQTLLIIQIPILALTLEITPDHSVLPTTMIHLIMVVHIMMTIPLVTTAPPTMIIFLKMIVPLTTIALSQTMTILLWAMTVLL